MYNVYVYLGLLFVGLCLGSFAGAAVWRLRARQLVEDKNAKEAYDKKQYKQLVALTEHKGADDRSRCLSCQHQLAWIDLVPLVSWISTKGRCRYCQEPIGWFEPLVEIGTALFFILSFVFWPFPLATTTDITQFGLWLVAGVMLIVLFAYDMKWFLLPDRIVVPFTVVAALYALSVLFETGVSVERVISLVGAVAILSGIYLVLWLVSSGRWIGLGDVKLGVGLGLMLGSWELAFLALFLANVIGCLVVIPPLLMKKLSRTAHVPFGPMLIAGFIVTMLFGESLINWYIQTVSSLVV